MTLYTDDNGGLYRAAWGAYTNVFDNSRGPTCPRVASGGEVRGIVAKYFKTVKYPALNNITRHVLTTGADPEVFVCNSAGEIIPAWEVIPKKLDSGGSAKVYPDGFAVEIGAIPHGCQSYMVDSVQSGLDIAHRAAEKRGGKLVAQDVCYIPEELLKTLPTNRVELGCSPSLNACEEPRPIPDGRSVPFRTTGTHFHYGCERLQKMNVQEMSTMVAAVEAVRMPVFTAAFGQFENPLRRELYGRVGEFRKQPWGVEFRSTGAVPLRHPVLYHLVATLTRHAVDTWFTHPELLVGPPIEEVMEVSNNSDTVGARKLLKKYPICGALVRSAFTTILSSKRDAYVENIMKILTAKGGMGNELDIAQADCVAKNWYLNTEDSWITHSEGFNCNFAAWYNTRESKSRRKVREAGA